MAPLNPILALVLATALPASAELDVMKKVRLHNERLANWIAGCKKLPKDVPATLERAGTRTSYPTLPAALEQAVAGDVVVLGRGRYEERLVKIPTGVTLRGIGDETVVGHCEPGESGSVEVHGDDVAVEDVMFSAPFFRPSGHARMWLIDVGNGRGIVSSRLDGLPNLNVIRLFGHAYTGFPGEKKDHVNFNVAYKADDKGDVERGISAAVWDVRGFEDYYEEVVDGYRQRMPAAPKKRFKKFVDWVLLDPNAYLQADRFKRQLYGHLLRYAQRKHGIRLDYDVSKSDALLAKARASMAAGRPMSAGFFALLADEASFGIRSAEIQPLVDKAMAQGLAGYACSIEASLGGRPRKQDGQDAYVKELQKRLQEQYLIARIGARLKEAATCRIKLSAVQHWSATKSDVAKSYTSTLVETPAAQRERILKEQAAYAAVRSAERQAERANQARWDNMVTTAQNTWKSFYDHRTRIETIAGDKYLVSYKDNNPGAAGAGASAASAAAASAAEAAKAARRNAAVIAAQPGRYEEQRSYNERFSRNFAYSLDVDVEVKDRGETVLSADNPPESSSWGVSNCFAEKVGTPFESLNVECNDLVAGGTGRIDNPYYEKYVLGPVQAYLGMRWSTQLAKTLKAAEKKGPEDVAESYIVAGLLGVAIPNEEMWALTVPIFGGKFAARGIAFALLQE